MAPNRSKTPKESSLNKTTGKKTLQSESVKTPASPDWPAFRPLVPLEDLACHSVVPGQIITISNFWTSTLCKNYVAHLSSLPLATTPGRPKKGEAVRVNDRFQIDDPAFADRLWNETALKELVSGPSAATSEDEREQLWGGKVVSRTLRLICAIGFSSSAGKDWFES
jgi:hypothetical protein